MKILMLPTQFGGISWWRFETPAKALRALGHEVTCPTHDEAEACVREHGGLDGWLSEEMPKHDILHTGYTGEMLLAKHIFDARDRCDVPVVVDIDDDIDSVPTYNSGWKSFRAGSIPQRVAKTQLAHADAITFSTEPLSQALAYLAQDKESAVLGNWVDVDSWDCPTPPERAQDESIRLMLTGGNGRFGDWEVLKEPLEWAMKRYDGTGGRPMLRLFFMGVTPDWVRPWLEDNLDPLKNRCFYLQPTQDVPLFNQAVRYVSPDIILSPTLTNTFNRSKSGLKYLESALAGAAFLCTDYDTYAMAPKGTCLKVDNTYEQWTENLRVLIEGPGLRAQLVERARDHVLDSCTIGGHIIDRVAFYEKVVARRKAIADSHPGRLVGGLTPNP